MELHQRGLPGGVREPEGVDPEALHHPVGPRDAAVAHEPQGVVLGLGVQGDEVPEGVVRALGLGDLPIGMGLGGVDDVGELDAVLDEEHRDVVGDQVEGSLVGVELRGEAAGVAGGVHRAAGADDGGEAGEHLGALPLGEESGPAHGLRGAVPLEDAVGGGAAGVDHSFRDPLVVEVGDLLAQVVVLQQHGAASARLQRVVGVAQARSLRGRQEGPLLGVRAAFRARLGAGGRARLRALLIGLRREGPVRRGRLLELGRAAAGPAGSGGGGLLRRGHDVSPRGARAGRR